MSEETTPPTSGEDTERVNRDGPIGVPTEDVHAQEAEDIKVYNETRGLVENPNVPEAPEGGTPQVASPSSTTDAAGTTDTGT